MDKEIADLLNLQLPMMFTLASGYAAYVISNVGLRDHHKPVETAFSTLVFGFFARLFFDQLLVLKFPVWVASIVGFIGALAIGWMWCRLGRRTYIALLRKLRISQNDEMPSAWISLIATSDIFGMQLMVKTTDGVQFFCNDLAQFADLPNGPCTFGSSGDLLMYVTHRQFPEDSEITEDKETVHPEWGAEITYIPKEKIERLSFRRKSR